ncbi:uncharacterized protein TNCV_3684981 [Trichonephila clavipes]|uniref:Transposase n=1 Tax=Trichonephila clavipes TaxID=2585209 RepID=A0A8X6UWI3_TRICX|nr:uncharacterized protein TNCV_3684981 [Trichonephila clavipes]
MLEGTKEWIWLKQVYPIYSSLRREDPMAILFSSGGLFPLSTTYGFAVSCTGNRKERIVTWSERSFKKICLENRFATTKVIKSQLQDINVNASERTVRRKLKDLNFKTCRSTRKSELTPAIKAKRLNWAKHWRDKDVYFWRLNKTQFERRRRHGEKFHSDCVVQTVKHPTKIMIWSVISGKGRLYVVKARSIKAFLAEQNIPLLDWPGNSPDMNPIENIWELMKREVAKDVITNKTQLLERIIHVWNHPQMQETVVLY